MEDVLPFLMMMIVECVEVGTMTLVKAAMNNGMSQLVYVVYSNLLGTIVLFPFFAVHNHRLVTSDASILSTLCSNA